MPIRQGTTKSGVKKETIIDIILAKYRSDPEGFRSYMPDLAQTLDAMFPSRGPSASPFGLTEHERTHRQQALQHILESVNKREASRDEAIRALEHCAVLIEDDSLNQNVGYSVILQMLRIVIGKPLSAINAITTIPIPQDQSDKIINRISLLRGVVLKLSRDMRLVSISVTPRKVEERRRAMRFVAIAKSALPSR